MLRDEVRQILRELAGATGAEQAWIGTAEPDLADDSVWARPLGGGAHLALRFADGASDGADRGEALERACRSLRAAARRWGADLVPEATWPDPEATPSRDRVIERVERYLVALAGSAACENALVTLRGELVAAARAPSELESERIEFAVKRVDAEAAQRAGTSHGEIVGEDLYARGFWHEAYLIVFFSGPWATDFVKHRARLVCRELSHLLALLDEPPPSPAMIAPIPE